MNHNDRLEGKGSWQWGNEGVDWELYESANIPSIQGCTAAYCVALDADNRVVLVQENRGWGLPGGHVEDGESIVQTLERECLEEAGLIVKQPILFAYRKIIATEPVTHPTPGKAYPFPISYIAYYWARRDAALLSHTDEEVLAVRSYSAEEINQMDFSDKPIVLLAFKAFLS